MTPNHKVLFGLGLENGVHQVNEMLRHARLADEAGLDLVSVSDHPYFADRVDAYAALGFVLGETRNITGAVIMTNLLSRPAPILARTVTGLSTISTQPCRSRHPGAGRAVGRKSSPSVLPCAYRPLAEYEHSEEAIMVVRALSGGGDPVDLFEGEFYQVTDLTPAAAPAPPIWIGALGPKTLAVTGRHADGWIPGHLADWRSKLVAESRPVVDEAATSVGRNPLLMSAPSTTMSGLLSRVPLPEDPRHDEGHWVGGGVTQWVEELSFAVLERGAAAFIYLLPPGDTLSDTTLHLWAQEVVPGVREAIAKR